MPKIKYEYKPGNLYVTVCGAVLEAVEPHTTRLSLLSYGPGAFNLRILDDSRVDRSIYFCGERYGWRQSDVYTWWADGMVDVHRAGHPLNIVREIEQ